MIELANEFDVETIIPFQCQIGNVEAKIVVIIEPKPHGEIEHAHFHTAITCPKIKMVHFPEPDRCQITDETCPFWEPKGGLKREPSTRKWLYAHQLIQVVASIELTGTQLMNMIFKNEGLSLKGDPRLMELNRLLIVSKLIDKDVYYQLEELRDVRNKLAHDPNKYLEFEEIYLFGLSFRAEKIDSFLRERIKKY